MEFVIQTRSEKTKKFIEYLMRSMIKQLGLKHSRKAVMIKITKDIDDGNDGCTVYLPRIEGYVILIKPGSLHHIGLTLAHEMVHVRQMAKGMLRTENGVRYWRGKRYTKRTKYLDTPWEIDAFSKQELILRRALE